MTTHDDDQPALGYLEAVNVPLLATRQLRHAIERCLAAGMSPRAIHAEVGMAFWGLVEGGVEKPEPERRWPRCPMGGWSDEPSPAREQKR